MSCWKRMRPTTGMSARPGIGRLGEADDGAAGPALLRGDQAGQPLAEEDHGEPGDHLVDAERHHQPGEDQRDHGRGDRGDDEGEERLAGDDDGADAGHRAHQHEALGAEREHARLLGEDQAERGEREGHGEAGDVADPVDQEIHQPVPRTQWTRWRMKNSDAATADDDDRLDELNHGARDLVEDLEALAGDEEHADEGRDEDRDERIVAGEEGDEDAGEGVAEEEGLRHPALDAGAHHEAADARDRAREQRRDQRHRRDRHADRRRHLRVGVDEAGVEAEAADIEQPPDHHREDEGERQRPGEVLPSRAAAGARPPRTARSAGRRSPGPSTGRRADRAGS